MVGREVVGGEEIGAEYFIPNIGDGEVEGKISFTDGNGACEGSVALNVCAICCTKLGACRPLTTLLRGGRDDGEERAPIHQPLLISSGICDVKKEGFVRAAGEVVHEAYITGFPFGALCCGFSIHHCSHCRALSPKFM